MMSTAVRDNIPVPHTRSAFEKNFTAAAIAKSPTMIFTSRSHDPARGSAVVHRGASARRKKGSANTVENTAIPTSGTCHSPREADTTSGPTNGAVHVNDASVNAKPISTDPAALPDRWRAELSIVLRNLLETGSGRSERPSRLS